MKLHYESIGKEVCYCSLDISATDDSSTTLALPARPSDERTGQGGSMSPLTCVKGHPWFGKGWTSW